MKNNEYLPEGNIISTYHNRESISGLAELEKAKENGAILEALAQMCDEELTLHFDLNGIHGIMKKEETMFCRKNEVIKDIAVLTRVGKPVCFKILGFKYHNDGQITAILSRKAAQRECMEKKLSLLKTGDIINAKVTHLENFGAFIDIGCGISSLLSVDSISVSRISHPRDRLYCGMNIKVVVKTIDKENQRIFVSQRELLGTWEENVAAFSAGQTVTGIIRSIESYGVFIELTPNLAGLAETADFSDLPYDEKALIGQKVAVYIKSIIPERMKIKLVIIDICKSDASESTKPSRPQYFVDCESLTHISYWRYSPLSSKKIIETDFDAD